MSDLAVQLSGPPDAPALVLLPSLGSDRQMWRPQVAALATTRQVAAVELWGHGASPTPPGPHTLAAMGAQVLSALDEAGIGQFDLAGISLGGQLALWLAARHPDRVRRLVAGATAARIGSTEGWDARISAVRDGGMAAIADLALSRLFSDRCDPETFAEARSVLLSVDPEGYTACCAALRDADLTDALPTITAPTLLVAGSLDPSTPPAALHHIAGLVPGARVQELEAGHLLNLEAPAAFTAALRAHLEST